MKRVLVTLALFSGCHSSCSAQQAANRAVPGAHCVTDLEEALCFRDGHVTLCQMTGVFSHDAVGCVDIGSSEKP